MERSSSNVFSQCTIFSQWYAQHLLILDLRKIGCVLQTGCKFQQSYTRLHNERFPEERDALQTGHQCWGVTLPQRSHNVAWMLFQRQSPMLGSDIATKFTQHCLNIVSTLVTNVATMFTQHCSNIGTLAQHWYNIMFTQLCGNVHTQRCGNIVKCLQINIVTILGSNVATTFTQGEQCHNIGIIAGYSGYWDYIDRESGWASTKACACEQMNAP